MSTMEKWKLSANFAVVIGVLAVSLFLGGCGTKTMVVLLPEADGSVGEVTVTTREESQKLNQAYESAQVGEEGQTLKKGEILDSKQVHETFGEALDIQPFPPVVFMLYFKSGGTDLTDASSALIPLILKSIAQRQSRDISVVGHTDRVGTAEKNRLLSMDRAGYVAGVLAKSGVDTSLIEVSSHGENNPVISTEDEVAEPKNRRVEVMVR